MLTPVSDADLYEHLSKQLLPGIREALDAAGPGQRLRVTTLPVPVMERVCEALQGRKSYRAFVLARDPAGISWRASSTKLIELRNVLPEPLLVFIPPDLRTAAEDSLDIATFTELALRNVTDDLRAVLLEQLPEQLRKRVAAALEYIRIERILMNADEAVEYLLTVVKNRATPEAAGAALHCFGLIPDLAAFSEAEVEKRLSRNWNAVRVLDEPGSPLARIQKLPLEPNTIQKRLFVFLRGRKPNCRIWGRDIAQESVWSELSFDRWKFAGDIEETAGVRLILEELDLPLQTPDQVGGSAQLRVLNLEDTKAALKVVFRSLPRPAEVPAWTHYRFQVLSTADGDPEVAWESNSYPKPAGKQKHVRRSVKAKDLQALEEGTYFVKVDAYDANGNLLTTVRELDPRNPDSRKENESDHFLVVRGDAEVEQPEARAVFTTSLIDAWASLSTRALGSKGTGEAPDLGKLHGRWTEPLRAPTRGDVHFALDHEDGGGHTIVVPGLLRKVEAEIIAHPNHLGLYRLNLAVAKLADVSVERREQGLGHASELSAFLETREALFKAISEQHGRRAPAGIDVERSGLVETADLVELEPLVRAYVDAYVELASLPAAKGVINVLCQLDVVELRWIPTQVDPGRGLLLAPTHPVRVAWHFQHARQLRGLIDTWRQQTEAPSDLRSLVETYRRDVQATHAPPVLFDSRGRGYVEQGPLTSHWSLFLPDAGASGAVIDVAASRDRARAQLGVRGSSSVAPSVGSLDLARRLLEYLQLHPYVEQLHLNVFNPGDATLIADALRQLEKERRAIVGEPPLRYVVRLLAPRAGVDLTGDALESLLDPVRQVGEDDEFTLASSNHLHPKLVFARNSIEEFLARPNEFGAHLSIMLEQFAVHSRVGRVDGLRRGSYVTGLLQEPEIQSDVSGGLFAWQKGLNPRAATIADDWERRLVRSLSAGQHVQALGTLGTEEAAADVAPLLAMQLDARGQALLKQVHIASDWVLTVDRNLGLEFYDSPGAAKEAGYLLDFAPEYLQQDRLRLMLTTRSTHELEAIVRPAVESFGLKLPTDGEVVALEGLRSLSGRLALRFMSSATQSAEVVGLLLARWLLEEVGVLSERIVVPLDAHRSWFTSGERSQQRADLLLVSFDPKSRTVFGKVVEVKLREELPAAARSKLYRKMREQSDNTVEVMRSLFDLDYYAKPRADRLLRAKELSTALAFYVRRAQRYRLLGDAEAKAALDFVQDLDAGYHLDLSSLGVVFERMTSGAHVDEEEPGYVVHRFGRDVASRLVNNARDRFTRNDTSRSPDAIGSDASPPSTPPPEGERSADFDSFRDAVDRGSPPLSNMVPESQRPQSSARSSPRAGNAPTDRAHMSAPVARASSAESTEGVAGRVSGVPSGPVVVGPTGASAAGADAREPEPYAIKQDVPPQTVSDSARPPAYGAPATVIVPDVLVGSTELTSQYGILGKHTTSTVGIDLNGCNTISLFGVQGFGKSYTLGVISEMAAKAVPRINVLPAPLATVIFHYHKADAYEPEYASAVLPNHKARELEALRQEYGANPAGLDDVVLLTPEAKIEQRTREFPNITVLPIKFSSGELGAESWKFLLGAYGNDSLYVRQMVQIMRQHRGGLTLDVFRHAIASSGLPAASRNLADTRITFAEPYIDDQASLGDLLRPGRTVIVDLRDEWIEKDEALGLFVVMLRIFAASKFEGREFNKLVVFDEAHKYITESDLIGQVVETIREMRHQATSVVIASQDPLSVPRAVIELTSILLLHRMTSPAWLKHLKGAISALDGISDGHVAALKPGEALLWAQRSTDVRFTQRPQKITIRPRFTQHGGGTKTAVAGQTVR